MRVKILGAPLIEGVEGDVPVHGTSGAILSLLASRPGRAVSFGTIESHCWNGNPPRTSKSAIHVAVHKLRSLLEPQRQPGQDAMVLVTANGGYRLDLAPEDIDGVLFGRHVETSRRLIGEHEWNGACELLQEALALWRGPAFGEFGDRAELMVEERRLDELRLEAEELLSEAQLWAGRASLSRLQALATAEQLRERRWRHLMLGLYRAGRHAEALRAFSAATSALVEVGLEPSPALARLEEQILLHDPALYRTPSHKAEERHANPDPPPLIGRESELDRLLEAAQPGRLVTVVGPPGVGKTSLVRSVIARAAVEVTLVQIEGAQTGLARQVRLALTGDEGGDARSDHVEAIGAVVAAGDQMVILNAIDDHLEEAGDLTGALIAACPSVRLVATSREPVGVEHEEVMVLEPFPVPGTEATVSALAENPAVQLFLRRAEQLGVSAERSLNDIGEIARLTDGLPAALEVAAALSDVLDPSGIADHLKRRARVGMAPLSAVVDTSLHSMSKSARQLIRVLSDFSGPLDLGEVTRAAANADRSEDLIQDLSTLVRKSLVRHDGGLYSILNPIRQAVLASDDGDRTSESVDAAHWRTVVEIAVDAAEQLQTSAYASGMDALSRRYSDITSLIRQAVDRRAATVAWTLLGALDQYWWAIQARTDAIELADTVVTVGRNGVDPEVLTRGLTVAGLAGLSLASMVDRIGYLEEAAALASTVGPGSASALAMAHHAIAMERSQRFHPSSVDVLERAIEYAEASRSTFARAHTEIAAGLISTSRLDLASGVRACVRAAAIAETIGNEPTRAYALMWGGHIAAYADEPERSQALYRDAIETAVAASLGWVEHQCRIGLAEAVEASGDPGTALDLYRAAALGLREHGDLRGSAVAAFRAATLETGVGNFDQAERLLAVAIPDLRKYGDETIQASSIVALAQLDLALGDPDAASLHLAEAEALFVAGGVPPGPLTRRSMETLRGGLGSR